MTRPTLAFLPSIGPRARLRPSPRLRALLAAAVLASARIAGADEATCGPLTNAYGPFDYRTADAEQLKRVEDFHFTPDVETLRSGKSGSVGGDLDYTLRAFPNHHRALVAMINLEPRSRGGKPPPGAHYPVPCYFERAIRFRPDDRTVRTIFGVYLMRHKKLNEAIAQFEQAIELGDDSGNLHYNAGLAYFEARDYEKAVAHAKAAYAKGFSLPGLRDKLKKAGQWPPEPSS